MEKNMIKSQKVIFQKLHKLLTERALSELHGGSLFRTFNIFIAIHSFSISQFVISEGAWNCGRKSGVSKVNCEKFESSHRTRVPYMPAARSIQCTWLHNKHWFKANSKQKTLAWLKLILLLFGSKLDLANLYLKATIIGLISLSIFLQYNYNLA